MYQPIHPRRTERAHCALPGGKPLLQALEMFVSDHQGVAATALGGSRLAGEAGGVHLRLRPDGRLLELPQGKITIGSSPRCNVRLQQPGIQPVHCLIIHGPESLTVRSWAGNTRLNGATFQESALNLGDCLSVGPVELEVDDTKAGKRAEPPVAKATQVTRTESMEEFVAAKAEPTTGEVAQLRQELDTQQRDRETLDEVNERNRQLTDQVGELTARIEQLTRDQAELAGERKELADDHASLQERHREVLEETSRLQGQWRENLAQVEALREERDELRRLHDYQLSEMRALATERTAISDERAALCQERNELRRQNEALQERVAQLNEEIAALAAGKAAAAEQCDVVSQQRAELEARIALLSEENAQLAAVRSALADVEARLLNENKRLAELECEVQAAVAGRESASEELYRALLQVAELQEREDQHKTAATGFEALTSERERLVQQVQELREQVRHEGDERAAVESARQALADEAAALIEEQRRLAAENSELLNELGEARRQLNIGEQRQAEMAALKAELERERLAKQEAEATATAAAADREARLREQAQQFAERIYALEERLSEAEEKCRRLEQAKQRAEAAVAAANADGERKFEMQAQQLAESIEALERRLAAADEKQRLLEQAKLQAEDAVARAIADGERALATQAEEFRAAIRTLEERLAAAEKQENLPEDERRDWQLRLTKAEERADEQSGRIRELEAELAETKAIAAESALRHLAVKASEAPGPIEPAIRPATPALTKEESPASNNNAAEAESISLSQPATSSASVARPEHTEKEATLLLRSEDSDAASASQSAPASKPQGTSFIERYAHMFAEEGTTTDEAPTLRQQSGGFESPAPKLPSVNVVRSESTRSSAPKSEDEESIEQYMAKLLQRMRGDSASSPAANAQPSAAPLNAPEASILTSALASPTSIMEPSGPTAGSDSAEGEVDIDQAISRLAAKAKAAMPAEATDLVALRALANETARLAISRHELRKLRRNAVTKVIVSTLAGVTSLWLMLDSPSWHDIQFITACVSLLVAAIWAGETYRTLVEAFRTAAYDGGTQDDGDDAPVKAEPQALPIDVE